MVHHNSQENKNYHGSHHVCNSQSLPSKPQINSQQQQQQSVSTNNNNNENDMEVISSQSVSLTSSESSNSMESTSSQVKTEDELFDKIEDMICEYMRESNRHYLHCRVLRWSLDEDLSCQFSAVIVINPPITKK
jgi:hypothetical protein